MGSQTASWVRRNAFFALSYRYCSRCCYWFTGGLWWFPFCYSLDLGLCCKFLTSWDTFLATFSLVYLYICYWFGRQVMYDATGVRLHAGRQAEVSLLLHLLLVSSFNLTAFLSNHYWFCHDAFELWFPDLWGLIHFQVLNQIVFELPAEHPLAESRPLRELLGHTPPQVCITQFDWTTINPFRSLCELMDDKL